jgi:hypothetical protein
MCILSMGMPSRHEDITASADIGRTRGRRHRAKQNGSGSAQRSYERYLALAQEEAQSGNIVAAENYYQHAEHYYRSMSRDRGEAL